MAAKVVIIKLFFLQVLLQIFVSQLWLGKNIYSDVTNYLNLVNRAIINSCSKYYNVASTGQRLKELD